MRVPAPSRRRFLRRSLSGLLVLGTAGMIPSMARSAFAPSGQRDALRFFSRHEHRLLQAVAESLIGAAEEAAADAIDVAGRADAYLALEDPEIQSQIHLLLAIFGSRTFAFLFDFRFDPFLHMDADARASYLEDWMTSPLEFRRTGFVALKRICLSMHYTDSRSFAAVGYEGMFLPEDRP